MISEVVRDLLSYSLSLLPESKQSPPFPGVSFPSRAGKVWFLTLGGWKVGPTTALAAAAPPLWKNLRANPIPGRINGSPEKNKDKSRTNLGKGASLLNQLFRPFLIKPSRPGGTSFRSPSHRGLWQLRSPLLTCGLQEGTRPASSSRLACLSFLAFLWL